MLTVNLCWLESEGFKLSAPLGWRIAKSLDAETAWQATFDRRPDQIWREERERDRHVDLAHAAFLTSRDLLNVGYRARLDPPRFMRRHPPHHLSLPQLGRTSRRHLQRQRHYRATIVMNAAASMVLPPTMAGSD